MRRKEKLVCGVGINDLNRPVVQKVLSGVIRCPIYERWRSMLVRCYDKTYHSSERYSDCYVIDEWLKLSNFEGWMICQKWKGRQLDKDILFPGNKLYSPETCVFIDDNLNKFLTDSEAARGELPLGVARYRNTGRYAAQCCNPFEGGSRHLGIFDTVEEAHRAWKLAKHRYALRFADLQDDTRVAEALRKRYI